MVNFLNLADVRVPRAGLAVAVGGREESVDHPEAADVRAAASVPLPTCAGETIDIQYQGSRNPTF